MELRDKVAVVTGGKRIGRVVARELASRGMDLVLSYRGSKAEADQTVSDVQSVGRRGTVVAADVSKPADCEAVIAHALATFGRVDALVNMASIYRSTPLERTTVEYWDTDLDINVRAARPTSSPARRFVSTLVGTWRDTIGTKEHDDTDHSANDTRPAVGSKGTRYGVGGLDACD